jgi:hypothetical protein
MDAGKVAAPKGTTTGVGGSGDGSSSSAHGRNTLRDELQKDGGLRIIQEIDEEPPSGGGSTGGDSGDGSPGQWRSQEFNIGGGAIRHDRYIVTTKMSKNI